MKRSEQKETKKRSPFWLYFQIGAFIALLVCLVLFYNFPDRWLDILPFILLTTAMVLFSRTRLRGWWLVLLSFIRYLFVFLVLTYGAFVVLDLRQGVPFQDAVTAPYRLLRIIFVPTMPFSGILAGIVLLIILLFALPKRKNK